MHLIEGEEGERSDDRYDGRQAHALQLHRPKDDGCTGEAGDHRDCGQDQISGLRIVHMLFDQHADTGSCNEAEEEDADAAHDRSRDAVDERGDLSDEGEEDGKAGSTADDPGAVDARHRHDAHVFTIRGIRRRADEAGDHIRQAVCKERAVKSRVFDEVASDDIARDEEMADMFGEDHEERRKDHHDGREIEMRRIEGRQGEPWHLLYMREVYDTHEDGENVAGDDTDQDRDDGDESAPKNGRKDGDDQGEHGDRDGSRCAHALRLTDEAGHGHGERRQLEPDDRDDRAHGSRREEDIDPADADLLHEERDDHEAETEGDEAALGIRIRHARRRRHRQHRRDEGEGRAEVGRELPFADGEVEERPDAVHEKAGRGVYIQEEGHQHRGAKHGEEVLQREGDGGEERKPFLDLDDSFAHKILLFNSDWKVGRSDIRRGSLGFLHFDPSLEDRKGWKRAHCESRKKGGFRETKEPPSFA